MATDSREAVLGHGSVRSWVVCLSAALFFFYEFIQMNVIDAINMELMETFSLTATDLGLFSSVYFYANVIFLLPAAMILDRISTRRVILTALLVCTLGNVLFASSGSLWLATVSRFLTGIGSAFCFLSCIRLASRWFPPSRMALVSGFVVTMAMAGGMVAQAPMTYLTELYGWRHAVMLDGLLGLVIWAMIWFLVEDFPAGQKARSWPK
jgi:predicted MFS family arabinose efflux permease